MNFDFLQNNLYECLVFAKHVYFKKKPFLNSQNLSSLDFFLLDRFLQHHPLLQNPKSWKVNKSHQTAYFKLITEIPQIEAEYLKFVKQPLTIQINQLLNKEYDLALPELSAGGEWELVEVPMRQLTANQIENKELSPEVIQDYVSQLARGRELIGGVYVPRQGNYRLVDGYHRLQALKQFGNDEQLVPIISFSAT